MAIRLTVRRRAPNYLPPESGDGGVDWGKAILYGLIALLVFSPLPQGSVLEWSVLVIELAAVLLAAAWLLRTPKPAINPYLERGLVWPRRLFLIFGGVVVVQLIPLPRFLIRLVSPGTYAFLKAYSPEFGRRAFASLSLAPGQTLREGLFYLALFLVGMVIIHNITRFSQVQKLVTAIVLVGTFEALFGLFELSAGSPSLLFYSKTLHLDSVTGTFVNRNHLAGYLEMVLPLAVGLILSRIGFFALRDEKARFNWRQVVPRLGGKALASNALLALSVIIMAVALIRSRSRSGAFLLFFTFLLFGEIILYHFSGSRERQRVSRNFVNVSFIIILVVSMYVGLGTVVNRFAEDDTLFRGGRTMFWGNVTSMIGDFPLAGTGLGTFASVYPRYDQSGFELRLPHAHNDYLEAVSDVGLAGGLALIGGILFLMFKIFQTWRQRRSMEIKGLAMGGLVSLVVMLFHSLTDFNLHIPANALLFTVILSLTTLTVYHKKSG
jgi:O-antigen ligase